MPLINTMQIIINYIYIIYIPYNVMHLIRAKRYVYKV